MILCVREEQTWSGFESRLGKGSQNLSFFSLRSWRPSRLVPPRPHFSETPGEIDAEEEEGQEEEDEAGVEADLDAGDAEQGEGDEEIEEAPEEIHQRGGEADAHRPCERG